jgi:putative CocE/NonD family hydrolase
MGSRLSGLLLIATMLAAQSACGVRVTEDVPVEMRDGVSLVTDVYLPPRGGPFPVVLSRTPYGTRTVVAFQPALGHYFAENGVAFVSQNIRGRFGSEGEFSGAGGGNEIVDGYDTVDWIVSQEWSNGIVGVMGESYGAYAARSAVESGHTAIKAMSSANSSVADERRTLDGAFSLQGSGLVALYTDDAENGQFQDARLVDLYHLPLITMGEEHGLRDVIWRNLVSGFLEDPRASIEQALDTYETVTVPAVHFGGWYGTVTRGTIATWRGVKLYGGNADASEMQWLVMGPWDHKAMVAEFTEPEPTTNIGNRDIGKAAVTTYRDTLLEFFTYFLKREDNGFIDLPRVQYFNIGENDWRYSEQWPPEDSRLRSLYLHSDGNAASADDGLLDFVPPKDEATDSYTYDPEAPVNITEDTNIWSRMADLPDRSGLPLRDDVLTYETGPLLNDMDITGPVSVEIYASSSAADTDFTAALVDVHPDGYSLLIQEGILRTSFRDKGADPTAIVPGEIYVFTIDLRATSYTVPAGHKLRIEISSSNFPRFARNLNHGETFGMSDRIEVAEQTIYHNSRHPSRLVLPVITH